MRRLIILLLYLLVVLCAVPVVAAAALNPPTNLTLTDLGGRSVGVSWQKGAGANQTMVRSGRNGVVPDSPTSGEQVYFGTGNTTSFFAPSLDTVKYNVAAWSWNGTDYSTTYAAASIGGTPMLFFALMILPLGLTISMFVSRQSLLGFPCVIFWGILGGYAYTQSSATWDWQYFLFFASVVGMVPFSAFAAFALRTKKEDREAGEEYIDETGATRKAPAVK